MKKQKEIKTNVMRLLEESKIPYTPHEYDPKQGIDALSVAKMLNQKPEQVFKTLVTVGKSKEHYVFVIPATGELDLKKAASASGEKNMEMIPQKELLPLTGYIHGGCSPIGMKKKLKTFIDESALSLPTICISAGKIGYQVEVKPEDLKTITDCEFVPLAKEA